MAYGVDGVSVVCGGEVVVVGLVDVVFELAIRRKGCGARIARVKSFRNCSIRVAWIHRLFLVVAGILALGRHNRRSADLRSRRRVPHRSASAVYSDTSRVPLIS